MLSVKGITLCIVAMLMLSAVAATAASAASPAWWVAKSQLKTGAKEAVANTTKVNKPFVIEGGPIKVECTSIALEEAVIEGENTGHEHAIVFKGCEDVTQKPCTVISTTSDPLKETLEGKTGSFKLNFEPTSGKEVGTVILSGSGCTATKLILVGSMACEYPNVETEAFAHVLDFTLTSGTKLEALGLGIKVKLTGENEFWLASEKLWSAR